MKTETIFTFLLVGGIVWGGFSYFLIKSIRLEKLKKKNGQKQT